LLLSGCSQSPLQTSVQVQDKSQTTAELENALTPFNREYKQISYQTKDNRNKAYLKLIEKFYQQFFLSPFEQVNFTIIELQQLKQQNYVEEYIFLKQALDSIDEKKLKKEQQNDFLLFKSRYFVLLNQFKQAEVLLDESFFELSTKQQQLLYWLQARIYQQNNQALQAMTSLLKMVDFNSKKQVVRLNSDKFSYYLVPMWDVMNLFPKEQLQTRDVLADEHVFFDPKLDRELLAWKQLQLIFINEIKAFALQHKLKLWKQRFPNNMAVDSFVDALYVQRKDLLPKLDNIALLLPVHGKLAKPIKTIIDGVMAAHFEKTHGNDIRFKIYDTSQQTSIWPLYKQAVADGANIIIGPLNKAFVAELGVVEELEVTTLALNNSSEPAEDELQHHTKNLYQFALKPEDEVSAVARLAQQDGHKKVAILVPDSAWGERMSIAFTNEWEKLSAQVVSLQTYVAKGYDFKKPITSLLNVDASYQRKNKLRYQIGGGFEFSPRIRQDVDMIFLAAFPKQGKQIPLQISFHHGGKIPIYTTSHIIKDAFNEKENGDLNGIIYSDMPWLLQREIPAISRMGKQKNNSARRLFSLGVDSYALLPYLKLLQQQQLKQFAGETAKLYINENGYIKRLFSFAKIQNGKQVLYPPIKVEENYSE